MSTDPKFSIEDMKRKIAGLLAKAEATDNEEEQRAFSEKAEHLMVRLGIDAAELQSQGKVMAEDIVEVHLTFETIYGPSMSALAYRVGMAFGNLNFLQSRYKNSVRLYVIGHKSDVEQFTTLINSLRLQVMSAMKAFRKENREERRYYSIHQNFVTDRSFVGGYADTVAHRLRSLRTVEEATATPGAALVLVGKQERVDDWTAEAHPNIRQGRASRATYSSRGAAAGRSAGQQANLGGNSLGGGRAAIR